MNEGLVAMVANDLELQAKDALSEYTKNAVLYTPP